MLELSEPINVWVFFKGVHVRPHVFFWKDRKIEVETVNLMHTSRDGGNTFYHFSVSANNNFYKLRFDLAHLKWFLEAVEEG